MEGFKSTHRCQDSIDNVVVVFCEFSLYSTWGLFVMDVGDSLSTVHNVPRVDKSFLFNLGL